VTRPDWIAVAGNDDRFVSHSGNVCLGGLDHPVDISAGRVVDKRIDAVPVGIGAMKNVRFGDRDGYIAVRVRVTVIFEMNCGLIELHGFL
jgi:hypothetical protein